MVKVYQLRLDEQHIEAVQKATLNTKEFGIQQTHGLFGSPEWWSKTASGELPVHHLRGSVTKVYMGSMADWPEFTMRTDSGEDSSWSRFSNGAELGKLYVEGCRIELDYVIQRYKPKSWSGDTETKIVVEIRLGDVG